MAYPESQRVKFYAVPLGQDLEMIVYGHGGKPVLVFPSQDGVAADYNGFGMIDSVWDRVVRGDLQFFCIDSVDRRTVSDIYGNAYDRIRIYETWYNYVINAMVPKMLEINGTGKKPLVTGVSMGAYHAANFFFRRPDIFDSVIALSGLYETDSMYGGYMDEVVYANDPIKSLGGMPTDHKYIELYNHDDIIICVGQGAWEDGMLASTRELQRVMAQKGITAWVDYWGYDVNHDWPWWRKQFPYFVNILLSR